MSKKRTDTKWALLTLLGFLIILIGFASLYKEYIEATKSSMGNTVAKETADWKTYEGVGTTYYPLYNPQQKFSAKYPPSYSLDDLKPGVIRNVNARCYIWLGAGGHELSGNFADLKKEQINIGNTKIDMTLLEDKDTKSWFTTVAIPNSYMFEMNTDMGNQKCVDDFRAILETVTITSVPIQKYKNSEANIQFNYPASWHINYETYDYQSAACTPSTCKKKLQLGLTNGKEASISYIEINSRQCTNIIKFAYGGDYICYDNALGPNKGTSLSEKGEREKFLDSNMKEALDIIQNSIRTIK